MLMRQKCKHTEKRKENKILLWISSYLNLCTDCKYLCIFNPSFVSMLLVNFRISPLFLCTSLICCLPILNLSAKFVPFSPFSKHEIIVCLSFIKRMDCFHWVDMAVVWVYDWLVLCLQQPMHNQTWHSLSNIIIEPIRIQLNASCSFSKQNRLNRVSNTRLEWLTNF